MENGKLRCPLCGHIEIIAAGNTSIINFQFENLLAKLKLEALLGSRAAELGKI